jgi:hypothetical protein
MFSPMIKIDKDPKTGKVVGKYPPTLRVKIPYDGVNDKFNFDSFDMENNETVFTDIINKLKGGRTQLIVELTGIWIAGGKFGCTWKVVSAKFQLSQNNKPKFIEDSDTEKADNDEEEDEEEEVDVTTAELADTKINDEEETNEETNEEQAEEQVEEQQQTKSSRGRKSGPKK